MFQHWWYLCPPRFSPSLFRLPFHFILADNRLIIIFFEIRIITHIWECFSLCLFAVVYGCCGRIFLSIQTKIYCWLWSYNCLTKAASCRLAWSFKYYCLCFGSNVRIRLLPTNLSHHLTKANEKWSRTILPKMRDATCDHNNDWIFFNQAILIILK